MEKSKLWTVFAACVFLTTSCGPASSSTESSISASTSTTSSEELTSEDSSSSIEPGDIGTVTGLENATIVRGHYFNPFAGVSVTSTTGIDITSYLNVEGSVDYGTNGTYPLDYSLSYGDHLYEKTRYVQVQNGTYIPPTTTKTYSTAASVNLGGGSYRNGPAGNITHPMDPTYLEANLLDKPVPTNGWWTTLITRNYGGGNGIYLNPLRSSLGSGGVEITNVGKGFVQYWNSTGNPTFAQFTPFYQDLMLKTSSLNSTSISKVIDYSDNNVKVALRNSSEGEDEMVVTYTQGSPYVFTEFKNKDNITFKVDNAGVNSYQYLDLAGNVITSSYTGDALILKMVQRHVGYITSMPNIVGGGTYEDRYFLINAPSGTLFTLANGTHPSGYLDRIQVTLGNGNFLSVCALQTPSEASFYHQNGYAFMGRSNVSYTIDRASSVVHTYFRNNMQHVAPDYSKTGVMALLPHQYKKTAVSLSSYTFRTVRGTLKMFAGNAFETQMNFRGLLPSFTTPNDATYNKNNVETYLADLDARTGVEDEDFLGSQAPYWNAKALYPMTQALIISDQIGNETYKAIFKEKITSVLADWFSYNASNSQDRYLYYNQKWGSMYYSNNDFNTAGELSDHHFTHGYLVYSAAVLSMYDTTFFDNYKDIIEFFLRDYMEADKESLEYPELRCFDPWAGHSWAHGYGSFTEGNNQESSGEALNSWVAGYLFGLAKGDGAMVDAAIYGFTTELYAIKQYWFNYDEDNWSAEFATYSHVAGMVWGGKFDYATWFGSNPTFIYGIHWLPTGEYLSSYALGSTDKTMLSTIYAKYLSAAGGAPNTWYSNMWAIQALVNPSAALNNFNPSTILEDDYPNELVGSYWMVHAMQTLKTHTDEAWMEVSSHVSSSVYDTGNGLVAMVWNPSESARTVTFRNASGVIKTLVVASHSFTQVTL